MKIFIPIDYHFYCTLILFLVGLTMVVFGYTKRVAKYNLIVIIAPCLNVYCVLTVKNRLYILRFRK